MKLTGIDVSEHQGKIDWEKVKADGIKYAILRCGFGMDVVSQDDTYFKRNADECTRLGIPFGIYLYSYANTVEKAKSEAEHVLRLIKEYKIGLGVWYDLEDKIQSNLSKDLLSNIINTFCNKIASEGKYVGIYANLSWLNNKIEKSIKEKYPVWVAQYYSKCEYAGKYDIWQYSSSGKVNGISGKVDMNYLYNVKLINNTNSTSSTTIQVSTSEKDRIKSLQTALNKDFICGLAVDGVIGQATTKVVMSHYLKYYTSGNFVKWVQTQLKRKGYSIGQCGIDGGYGRDTESAIKKYQKNNKLTVDGCVGIEVVKSLIK